MNKESIKEHYVEDGFDNYIRKENLEDFMKQEEVISRAIRDKSELFDILSIKNENLKQQNENLKNEIQLLQNQMKPDFNENKYSFTKQKHYLK